MQKARKLRRGSRALTMVAVLLAASVVLVSSLGPSRAEPTCVVDVASWDVLWIRTGPGTAFARVTGIPAGACGVEILGPCERGWCRVSYGSAIGWVSNRYLGRATGGDGGAACVVGVANWDVLWLRAGPGTAFARIGSIPPNACGIEITGPCKGRWCRVTYGGADGWTNTRYLR